MNIIDETKEKLHNTSLYAKGHDFDSTKRVCGLYDVLEQLRSKLKTKREKLLIELGEIFDNYVTFSGYMHYTIALSPDMVRKVDEIRQQIKELEGK